MGGNLDEWLDGAYCRAAGMADEDGGLWFRGDRRGVRQCVTFYEPSDTDPAALVLRQSGGSGDDSSGRWDSLVLRDPTRRDLHAACSLFRIAFAAGRY